MPKLSKLTQQFVDHYNGLVTCCMDQETSARLILVTKCVAFVESIPDGDNGYAVCKLSDGSWVVFYESQDYTGHGCRCNCGSDGPWASEAKAWKFGVPAGDHDRVKKGNGD